jgi:meiotically up-regulated gene 157 (Mug157) protein
MAAIVRALTAFTLPNTPKTEVEAEVKEQIRMVLDSTHGSGVVHESVNSWAERDWSRSWFGWANGLLGELVLRIEAENPAMLELLWQDDAEVEQKIEKVGL